MKLKITDETFRFVVNDNAPTRDLYSLEIRKGRFKGVIFTYGAVKFDVVDEELKVNFHYTINESNSRYDVEYLNKSEKFKNFLGDILIYNLEKQLNNDEHLKTDTEETLY